MEMGIELDDRPEGCDLDGIGYINSRRFPSLIVCTAAENGEDGRGDSRVLYF
jgi:hypothetical protein